MTQMGTPSWILPQVSQYAQPDIAILMSSMPSRNRLTSYYICLEPISLHITDHSGGKACHLAPGDGSNKVYFGNSGAEAVEAAFKLARWYTKRELNLAFFGAFHGRTMGALSLTASKTIQKSIIIHLSLELPIYHMPIATGVRIICRILNVEWSVCAG